MAVRLEPQDEYMHELGPEPNFNESMYFNAYDPEQNVGGWFRIGNRANEGYAEMTICLYLPDGRVAFQFKRAQITSNDQFDAGGMSISVTTPFEDLSLRYNGKVVLLSDPLQMVEPKQAFTTNPFDTCAVDLQILGRSAMFGGEPDEPHETPGEEFAKGHYEQLHEAVGTIQVGDTTWTIRGFGLRDHSWGPRYWQAPWYYRWLTGNAGPDFGFMGSYIEKRPGSASKGSQGGFVWEGGKLHLIDAIELSTTWNGEANYHDKVHVTLRSSRSARDWQAEGDVMNLIPLRNRRTTPDGKELLTRISEGMTRWTIQTGSDGAEPLVGYGLSEYLDQIIDAAPVGLEH
jgi:hypothetical protein